MGTTNVNPINGVPFGQEKTREEYLARAACEYDQASRLRASQHPVGYQAIAEGHERAARAYEKAAEDRPSVPSATVALRTPLQEKLRKKRLKKAGRAHSTVERPKVDRRKIRYVALAWTNPQSPDPYRRYTEGNYPETNVQEILESLFQRGIPEVNVEGKDFALTSLDAVYKASDYARGSIARRRR